MRQHLTTVQAGFVECVRVVACAALGDSVDEGEEIARFPAGTELQTVRRTVIANALASRGVPYSADVFTHKGVWERFLTVRYEPSWMVDEATGIILEGRTERPESDEAALAREREAFERERAKRNALQSRRARAAEKYTKSGSDH